MNIVGVITEHNPFHNGHRYHVQMARQLCEADCVVSVMSGHFLQRGEPALFNKWSRAEMAVLGGVDMVVELPAAFSVRSAATFALGSVGLLNAMGVVTHLCFGSEAGDVNDLWPAARLLANEDNDFKDILGKYLNQGLPFPAARARAVIQRLEETNTNTVSGEAYASPNNILGLEYLRAILETGSDIKPVALKRVTAGYHDRDISNTEVIASATSIREELFSQEKITDKIKAVVPVTTLEEIITQMRFGRGPVFMENYSRILFYLLRTLSVEKLAELYDVTEGLENRIMDKAQDAVSVSDLLINLKTKRYTWTRLQRILTYILLGFTKSLAEDFDSTGPRYIRILGLSRAGRQLLKAIKKRAGLPVITRTAPYLNKNDDVAFMLNYDATATDIYSLLYPSECLQPKGMDFTVRPFVGE